MYVEFPIPIAPTVPDFDAGRGPRDSTIGWREPCAWYVCWLSCGGTVGVANTVGVACMVGVTDAFDNVDIWLFDGVLLITAMENNMRHTTVVASNAKPILFNLITNITFEATFLNS